MATTLLFLYGTLKRGFPSHSLLANEEFVGVARSLPFYRLFDCGAHPSLVEDRQAGHAVCGEVWRVTEECLAALDEFEEVPHHFLRREIMLEGQGPGVFAYFYRGDVSGLRDCGEAWFPTAWSSALNGERGRVSAPSSSVRNHSGR